jgi:hypothetical protein
MCSGELLERVRYAGSKLRLNDARYLLHALIDSSVEAVFPIISLYRQQLGTMSRKLHSYVQHKDPMPNAERATPRSSCRFPNPGAVTWIWRTSATSSASTGRPCTSAIGSGMDWFCSSPSRQENV